MKSAFSTILILFILMTVVAGQHYAMAGTEALLAQFQQPPAEARPFVRWWWNGCYLDKTEIAREIDILKQAGIGGFEINPIALPPVTRKPSIPQLAWLSDEWNQLVKYTADLAHQQDMIADLIVGSGWPFGGEFLRPDQILQKLDLITVDINGPKRYQANIDELIKKESSALKSADADADPALLSARRLFVRLILDGIDSIDQVQDLSGHIDPTGVLNIAVPSGKHTLCIGIIVKGFRTVVHGSPGAMGPVLDHYNKQSVLDYLNRMSDALDPAFGGRLGNGIRAVFCDSIELAGANWTNDMSKEFATRRGYAIEPWLPWLIDFKKPVTPGAKLRDAVRRARYDFCKTLTELFLERFTRTYHDWCHAHGAISRYQAYGIPFLMEMAEGYKIPDIPETNNWLFSEPDSHGFLVWTKYCSSGGHLTGRNIISTEAMTNTRGVFRATLQQIKAADDYNFIMGINHSVLHGFNYSPLSAGFPGWVRYGAYFSEQNSWWPYLRYWTDYNARLSAVFQSTSPVVQVAIMGPTADIWSVDGLARPPFHQTPWYLHQLWKTISNCGATSDYLGEATLQQAEFKDGEIHYGPMQYQALIVCDVESLQPKTVRALADYAQSGGQIAFINRLPDRAPGLDQATSNDQTVKQTIADIVQRNNRSVRLLRAPGKPALLHWTDELLDQLGIKRSVQFNQLNPNLYQIHTRYESADLFFLCNQNERDAIRAKAQLQTGNLTAWRWDPHTGQATAIKQGQDANQIQIDLPPLESLLLVYDNQAGVAIEMEKRYQTQRALTINTPWQASFQPVQSQPFTLARFELADLSQSKDPRLNQFAGTVTYKTNINLNPNMTRVQLDLGMVGDISEVVLNGKSLGVRWYGQHTYDLNQAVRPGSNTLQIKVTTTLNNLTRTIKEVEAARWYPARGEKPLVPAGLIGPVAIQYQH